MDHLIILSIALGVMVGIVSGLTLIPALIEACRPDGFTSRRAPRVSLQLLTVPPIWSGLPRIADWQIPAATIIIIVGTAIWVLAPLLAWTRHRHLQIQAEEMSQAQWWRARSDVMKAIHRKATGRRWIASWKVQETLCGVSVVVMDEVVEGWRVRGYLDVKNYVPMRGFKNYYPTSGFEGMYQILANRLACEVRLTHQGQDLCERHRKAGDLWRTVMEFETPVEPSRYSITIHSAGQVNVDPRTVNNIQSHIQSIQQCGDAGLALILARLTEAASLLELDAGERSQLLDAIEELSEAATVAPEQRRLPRIMRALRCIAAAASATTDLAKLWAEYGHTVEAFFSQRV